MTDQRAPRNPVQLQTAPELMDTALGDRVTDAAITPPGAWLKAVTEHNKPPSREKKGQSR